MAKHVNWIGYARMCHALAEKPMTANELSDRVGIARLSVRNILRGLQQCGIVRRAAWREPQGVRGQWQAEWAFGHGDDAPLPIGRKTGRPVPLKPVTRRRLGVELITFAATVRALQEPVSIQQLHEETGAAPSTLYGWMRKGNAIGFVHIADWRQRLHGGASCPLWAIGINKAHVKRPAPMPRYEVERRYREARRAKAATLQITNALAGNASTYQAAA